MHIIKESGRAHASWALFDGEKFIAEHLSEEQLEQEIVKITLKMLHSYLADFKPTMSHFEAEIIAGRIKCCDCGVSITPYEYQEKWRLDSQRCGTCYKR